MPLSEPVELAEQLIGAVAVGRHREEAGAELAHRRGSLGVVAHDIADDHDVADTVLYFLSDLARKVTGQVVHVDAGGYLP